MLGFDAAKLAAKINNFCRFSLFNIEQSNKVYVFFH